MRFKFSAKYLPMLHIFAARNDLRFYLCGFHIEPAEIGGVYLVATNGHAMLVIHDANGIAEGLGEAFCAVRISSGLAAAARSAARGPLEPFVLLDGRRLSIAPDFGFEHHSAEAFVQGGNPIIEGRFPDWRKIIPDFAALKPGALGGENDISVRLLAKFGELERGRKSYGGVALWQQAGMPDGAVVVQPRDLPEAIGFVMPMRGESRTDLLGQMKKILPKNPNRKTA